MIYYIKVFCLFLLSFLFVCKILNPNGNMYVTPVTSKMHFSLKCSFWSYQHLKRPKNLSLSRVKFSRQCSELCNTINSLLFIHLHFADNSCLLIFVVFCCCCNIIVSLLSTHDMYEFECPSFCFSFLVWCLCVQLNNIYFTVGT